MNTTPLPTRGAPGWTWILQGSNVAVSQPACRSLHDGDEASVQRRPDDPCHSSTWHHVSGCRSTAGCEEFHAYPCAVVPQTLACLGVEGVEVAPGCGHVHGVPTTMGVPWYWVRSVKSAVHARPRSLTVSTLTWGVDYGAVRSVAAVFSPSEVPGLVLVRGCDCATDGGTGCGSPFACALVFATLETQATTRAQLPAGPREIARLQTPE